MSFKVHINNIVKSANKRVWVIRNLKNARVSNADILEVYCAVIRSVLVYALPVFASSFTELLSRSIERVQSTSLKTIFGFEYSSRQVRELANIDTLSKRRDDLFQRFSLNTYSNERFEMWFQERNCVHYDIRCRRPLLEVHWRK